jgi:hypothetical protein
MARHGGGQLAIQQGDDPEEPAPTEPERLPFTDFEAEFAAMFETETEPEDAEAAGRTPEPPPPPEEPASFFF